MILLDQLYAAYKAAPEDPARQAALYKELCKLSLGIIYKHLRQRREDLAADAASTAMLRLHTFKGGSNFATWVYTIALNVARMSWRDTRREVPLEDGIEWQGINTTIPGPARFALSKQIAMLAQNSRSRELTTIIEALESGLSLREITIQLNIPRTTLWRRLRRIQEILK